MFEKLRSHGTGLAASNAASLRRERIRKLMKLREDACAEQRRAGDGIFVAEAGSNTDLQDIGLGFGAFCMVDEGEMRRSREASR